MRNRIWLFGMLAAAALLPGCELAVIGAGGAAAFMAVEDRRTSGTQIDDEGIELRAVNRVGERFGDKAHINVTSFNRSVLLTGEAPDARARAEIEKIAQAVPNLRSVTNEIQVGGVSALSARTNDAFITSKVKARFLDSGRFNPLHVKVVTEAGVVYLMGIVTEKEAADAVEVARTTAGVRKVVRIFEYCKPTDDACRPRAKPAAAKSAS